MKQHITVEQLLELSEKGQDRLREWGKPILSIGQMIEFIIDQGHEFEIRFHKAGSAWQRPGEMLIDILDIPANVSEIEDEIELCDALWELVKGLLMTD